jgi:CelD/BcsL family acetyltransferase involved in cellulose biosynthesis
MTCGIRPFDADARSAYAAFCRSAAHAAPQNPTFVEAWADNPGADMVLATVSGNGRTCLMLVLEIVRDGTATVARHPGGRHANGSFPAFEGQEFGGIREILAAALRGARPDVDLILLERNEIERAGRANPLHGPGCALSPNVALSANLENGFDALFQGSSGKRKRKKHRAQVRRFEEVGPCRRFAATGPAEVDALLSAFYEMKAERFRQMGITDVFAPVPVRNAFRRIFVGALDKASPDFVLHGLEVGGVLRAVTGSSLSGGRITCEFSSFRVDELAAASPGDFLFYENIREACEEGLSVYDFGVGDEAYKRQWCDIETWHFDFHLPLTARGHAVSAARRAIGAVKRAVKENRFVWSILKNLRKAGAGKPAPET